MVDAKDTSSHQALLDSFWSKVLPDVAGKGLSDADILSTSLEALLENEQVKGWKATIFLKGGEKLVYTQEAEVGSTIFCNDLPLPYGQV